MLLSEVISGKGADVYWTTPDETLHRVVELLVEYNCGSLVVYESDSSEQMVGIITERDIMKAYAAGRPLESTRVDVTMTSNVITGCPNDTVSDTMGLMTQRRIRHLPLVEDGHLRGMISIGDVVKAQHDELTAENFHLKSYIQDSGVWPAAQ